jgi:hypothetical protein
MLAYAATSQGTSCNCPQRGGSPLLKVHRYKYLVVHFALYKNTHRQRVGVNYNNKIGGITMDENTRRAPINEKKEEYPYTETQ